MREFHKARISGRDTGELTVFISTVFYFGILYLVFRLKIYPHILFLFSKRCNSHRSFLNYNSHIFRTSIFASFSFFALLFVGNVSQQNCIMPSFFNLYHNPANCKRHEFASKKKSNYEKAFLLAPE
jgi:hypothetical protein